MKSLQILVIFVAMTCFLSNPAIAESTTDWAGYYVGGNVGYGHHTANGKMTATDGAWFVPASTAAINEDGSKDLSGDSFHAGFQGGYNFQFGSVVTGIELGLSSFRTDESRSVTAAFPTVPGDNYTLKTGLSTDWLMTLRPRLGYAFGNFLIDVSCGVAVTKLQVSQTWNNTFTPSATVDTKDSETKAGLLAGIGLNYAINDHWSVRGEYLYASFGRVHTKGNLAGYDDTLEQSYDLDAHLASLGVNYRF